MSLFEARILRILGPAVGYKLSGHSGDEQIQHICNIWEIQLMCHIPPGNGYYLVKSELQFGEAYMLFGCQTVPIGCDKYAMCSVSWVVHHESCHGGYTELTGDWLELPWYQSRNPSIYLPSIRLLAQPPQSEWKQWQWTRQPIRLGSGMSVDHG